MIRPKCARCGEVFFGYGIYCEACGDIMSVPSGSAPVTNTAVNSVTNVTSVTNTVNAAVTNNVERQKKWRQSHAEESRKLARERMRRKRASLKS